jgi:dipeptide/tripeptide permease
MAPHADKSLARFPAQTKFILWNEAAERFSYYGVKGILALYITGVLLKTKDYSTNIIHLFTFVNYFMPLLGAWVSDRYWGRYHTILWISLSYCAGHGVMALSDAIPTVDGKLICLWIGLSLIAFGSGGIKPCVSAFMGDQFKPEQRHLLPKAYAAFYFAINLGSTLAFFVVPWFRKNLGYSWAFGVPGIAMALATFVFWLGTPRYTRVPPASQAKTAGFFRVLSHAFRRRKTRQPAEKFWDAAHDRFSQQEVDAASSVGPILSIFALIPVFWALFDQTFSTWVLQGEQMKSCFLTSATKLSAGDIKDVDGLTKAFLFGTNAASTRVTATNTVVGTNHAALFVWSQFSAESQQIVRDPSQPADARAQAIAAEFNRLIAGPSLYDPNRFASLRLDTDARLMLKKDPDPALLPRLNRVLLEHAFTKDLAKLYRIGPEEMLSANPILVMIFIPILTWGIYPRLGRWARPLRRMSVGLFLTASSYVVVAWLQTRVDAGDEVSILWQTVPYIILTLAEVLVSTTGLEFAFTQAAPTMKSTIMGFWNLTVAFGNLLVIAITSALGDGHGEGSVTPQRFMLYAGLTFVVAILFSLVAARYRYREQPAGK